MRRIFIRGVAMIAASSPLLFGSDTRGASAATDGIVGGQVSNQATGAFLEDARVEVKGAGEVTTTDREGRFEVALPAGPTVLRVSYSGLDAQEVAVDAMPGAAVARKGELTAGIYKMESFTVASQREGTAAAIMRQQQAPDVKNVVSSDCFGNVAEGLGAIRVFPGYRGNRRAADRGDVSGFRGQELPDADRGAEDRGGCARAVLSRRYVNPR